jgi:hypothetical protein
MNPIEQPRNVTKPSLTAGALAVSVALTMYSLLAYANLVLAFLLSGTLVAVGYTLDRETPEAAFLVGLIGSTLVGVLTLGRVGNDILVAAAGISIGGMWLVFEQASTEG